MKKILAVFCFCVLAFFAFSQSEDIDKLHENAKAFMRQGDYANASLILTRALSQAPNNFEIAKDLAYDYYLQKENTKALETIKPLLENDDADDQTFQIGGSIYRALDIKRRLKNFLKVALYIMIMGKCFGVNRIIQP